MAISKNTADSNNARATRLVDEWLEIQRFSERKELHPFDGAVGDALQERQVAIQTELIPFLDDLNDPVSKMELAAKDTAKEAGQKFTRALVASALRDLDAENAIDATLAADRALKEAA